LFCCCVRKVKNVKNAKKRTDKSIEGHCHPVRKVKNVKKRTNQFQRWVVEIV
jgi:hypothetical protein